MTKQDRAHRRGSDLAGRAAELMARLTQRFAPLLWLLWAGVVVAVLSFWSWEARRIRQDARLDTLEHTQRLATMTATLFRQSIERIQAALHLLAQADDGPRLAQAAVFAAATPYLSQAEKRTVDPSAFYEGLSLRRDAAAATTTTPFWIEWRQGDAVATGLFDMAAFINTLEGLRPPPGWSFSLLRVDGMMLARWPSVPAMDLRGWSFQQAAAYQRLVAIVFTGGQMIEDSPFDAQRRLIIGAPTELRAVAGHETAVAVTRSLFQEQLSVQQSLTNLAYGCVASLALSTLLLGGLFIAVRRRERIVAAAEAQSQMKSAFLTALSHELRTPLNAVIGFSEILRSSATKIDLAVIQEYLGHVHKSGQHLQCVVDRTLDFIWVEGSERHLTPAPLHLGEIIAGLRPQWEAMAAARAQRLHESCGPCDARGCLVLGDRFAARRVAEALAATACRLAGDGGVWGIALVFHPSGWLRLIAWSGAHPDEEMEWRPVTSRLKEPDAVLHQPDPDALALEAGLKLAEAMRWRLERSADGRAVAAVAPLA